MRRILSLLGLALMLVLPMTAMGQESVAEAARKAREKSKTQPAKAKKVYTDDSFGSKPSTSTASPADAKSGGPTASTGTTAASTGRPATGAAGAADDDPTGEKAWRQRFSEARKKLADAEKELDILQRELNLNQQQYYSDPSKAMNEQFTRSEINAQRTKIDDKKKEVAALKQGISDLEDKLRAEGKPAGWSRP